MAPKLHNDVRSRTGYWQKGPRSPFMCLAVPGRVLNVDGLDPAFRSGSVDFCGVRKTINLVFTPEVQPGDFVLVHVGFAISRIDEAEASRAFAYLSEIGALADEGLAAPVGRAETP